MSGHFCAHDRVLIYFDPLQVIVRGTFFLKVLIEAVGCFVFRPWGLLKVDREMCHQILCRDYFPL